MARLNLFEGSRRISLLLKIVWVLGVVAVAYSQTPYVSLHFTTTHPAATLTMSDYDCQVGVDAMEFVTRTLDDGRSVSAQLCFQSPVFQSNQQRLVPYKVESDQIWGNDRYSNDVTNYTDARANEFRLTPPDQEVAAQRLDAQRSENVRNAILFIIGGWIVLSILQALIGWIVRGFMGSPRGHDHRPNTAPPTASATWPKNATVRRRIPFARFAPTVGIHFNFERPAPCR